MKNRIEMIKQAAYIDELQKISAFKFPFKKIKNLSQTPKSVGENEISVLVPGKGFVKSENIKHAAYIDELQKIAKISAPELLTITNKYIIKIANKKNKYDDARENLNEISKAIKEGIENYKKNTVISKNKKLLKRIPEIVKK
jgi:hypothetical protein